jgi:hypothetical protein
VSWGLSCSATTHTLDSGDYGATRVVRHLSRIRANTQSESGFSSKHVWSNGTMLGALSDALLVGLQLPLIRLINVEILRNALSFHPHSTAFTARHGDPVRPKNTNCGGGESLAILPRVLKRLVLLLLWHSSLVCVHRTPIYGKYRLRLHSSSPAYSFFSSCCTASLCIGEPSFAACPCCISGSLTSPVLTRPTLVSWKLSAMFL